MKLNLPFGALLAALGMSFVLSACGGPGDAQEEDVVVVEYGTHTEALWPMQWGTTCNCSGMTPPGCPPGTSYVTSFCTIVYGQCGIQSYCRATSPTPPPPPPPGDNCGPGTGIVCP